MQPKRLGRRDMSQPNPESELRIAQARIASLEDRLESTKELLRKAVRRDDELWFDFQKNLWFAHNCMGERIAQKLPAKWWVTRDGSVVPSVVCNNCGAHFYAKFELRLTYCETKPFWSRGWQPKRPWRTPWKGASSDVGNRNAQGGDPRGDHPVHMERKPGRAGGGSGGL